MTWLVLSLIVVAFVVLCATGMWWSWRGRLRRQTADLPALSAVPADSGDTVVAPLSGVYVGTVTADDRQDRIVVGGLGFPARTRARLSEAGLLLTRAAASPLWIPAADLVSARPAAALAGTVLGPAGLLVIRWRLGEHVLDTGIRGDDRDRYDEWITAIEAPATTAGGTGGGAQ